MFSTPVQIGVPHPAGTTEEPVPLLYPGAWRVEAREKDEPDLPCVHPEGVHCKFPRNRRRMWSSLG